LEVATDISVIVNHKIKDQTFDVEQLHRYTLSICVGIRDLQLCVVDSASCKVLIAEDYSFKGVNTVNSRLKAIHQLYESHHVLRAGFWKNIKISLKTHKFTLVPSELFISSAKEDYLAINTEIKTSIDEVLYYKHIQSNITNVFLADRRLINWLTKVYPTQKLEFIHQGSSLIEGILRHKDLHHEKSIYGLFDRGILHLVVMEKKSLLYYNQFAVKDGDDMLKYSMLVFKELGLDQVKTKFLLWGTIKSNSKHFAILEKYIRNISFGSKPSFLKFSYSFDEIPDHQFFDLYNIAFCE